MGASLDSKRIAARIQFVEQGKNAKELAGMFQVNEKTVGNWRKKYNWDALRENHLNGDKARINGIKDVISEMTNQRLDITAQIKKLGDPKSNSAKDKVLELKKERVSIDDGISKWNKTLENMRDGNKVSLSTRLDIMNDIFNEMQAYDPNLAQNTIEFQEDYLLRLTEKYA
jgi:hypothetical protein